MSENWKIQVSPKLPDGTLVNLRAESADEMDRLLRFVEHKAQDITATAALLTGASNAARAGLTSTTTATSGFVQNAPVAPWDTPAPAPQAQNAPTCQHGQRVFKSGTGKRGPWTAWMCPTAQGTPGQCDPIWGN